jgi:hypothetical protein
LKTKTPKSPRDRDQKNLIVEDCFPLNIHDLEGGKNAISALIQKFYKSTIKGEQARTLSYMLMVFLSYCKTEIELENAARLKRIEARLDELNK